MGDLQHILVLMFSVVASILVVIGAALAIAQQRKRNEVVQRIADRFHGRLEVHDFFGYPKVRLRVQDAPAVLKFVHVGEDNTHTRLTITWPDPHLRCEIYPQSAFSGFRKLWGALDIEIGSPQFDSAYLIEGNSKSAVRELLTAEVQAIIRKLAALSPGKASGDDIQVKWADGVLTITKPYHLATYASLEQLILLSAELVAAATLASAGIEFVGEVKEPDAIPSQCQICGDSLSRDLVYCASCHTPHHRECWDYFGGCSTYACGQNKYVTSVGRRRET
jgi:hypothetical protein